MIPPSSQFVEISWHLIDLSVEVVLDLLNESGVLRENEVDGSTLSSETACSTNSVDVVFLLKRQLVVDNEADLLNVDTTGKQVSANQHSDGARSELLHDDVSFKLVHLAMHDTDCEVVLSHALLKLFNSLLGVTVNQGLVDVQVGIQVEQDFHLPFVLLNCNVVLSDTFKGKLLVFDKDLCGVTHEVLGHLQDFIRKCGRE